MLFDLNVPWPQTTFTAPPTAQAIVTLKNTLAMLEELGYTHVALNFIVEQGAKIPQNPNPIDLSLVGEFQTRLNLFTRVTLLIDDPSQGQGVAKLSSAFDIVAVCPRTEKALLLAVTNLDIDIITFNYAERLPCFLRHKTVGAAIEKGIKFEVVYSPAIAGPAGYADGVTVSTAALQSRRQFFNNAASIIRASRSRGLVLSSGAASPLQCRGSFDVCNLLILLDLDHSRCKAAMTEVPSKVVLSGRLRGQSYKQTVIVGQYESLRATIDAPKRRKLGDTPSGNLMKRQKELAKH
ncbi:hypothetical protein BABINDRAFT_38312 [Babjeviella inositovora NRRL Y-12698]|uniref:PHP domain-like protein n=1 Tax=Babjeviella inositovora NRRL Y-12698 TaxID=984486 RepID=A0A1E3QNJ0_9ASCO|nr:uncharacterized protein BABINDRAFT_38312 [Babjeviella inositovora NRRL Y-12698]ODQ79210.1 hypothetical protein BABINDRAFT_38312 [Babjeviella inositovora NRRL Y-12698]